MHSFLSQEKNAIYGVLRDFTAVVVCVTVSACLPNSLQAQATPQVATVYNPSSFQPSWNRHFADVNGDGKADLVWRHGRKVLVRLSTGSGFGSTQQWGAWPVDWEIKLGDVNGDGLADIVGRSADAFSGIGAYIYVSLSNGIGFLPQSAWTYWSPDSDYILGDFNGDRKTDLVGRVGQDLHVALSNGSSFLPSQRWTYWNQAADYKAGDFNGDGITDIAGRLGSDLHVALSTGASFAPSTIWTYWNPAADYIPMDIDGDGRTDIASKFGTDLHVAVSQGLRFAPSTIWGKVAGNGDVMFGDVTGDRKADVVLRRIGTPIGTTSLAVGTASRGRFSTLSNWIQEPDRFPSIVGSIDQNRLRATLFDFCYSFGRRATIFKDKKGVFGSNMEAAENYIVSELRRYGYFVFVEPVFASASACGKWILRE